MATDLSSALGSFNFGGMLDVSGLLAYIIIILMLLGTIIFLIFYMRSFKDLLIIREPIGNSFTYRPNRLYKRVNVSWYGRPETEYEGIGGDDKEINVLPYIVRILKCKIITKKGVRYLKAFRVRRLWKIPDQVFQATTVGGKKCFDLTKLSEHIFAPNVLTNASTGDTSYIYDETIFSWVINDIENDHKKYMKATFWDKYGNLITILAVLIVVLIVIVVTLKYSDTIVQNAIKAVTPLVNALIEATKQLTVQQIANAQAIP